MEHNLFICYSGKDLQRDIAFRDEIMERLGVDSWIDIKVIESGKRFMRAAEFGFADTQYYVGRCHNDGQGNSYLI